MTNNYHTPIPEGAAANADTFNDPLGEMDEALTEALLEERDGHIIQEEGVDLAQQARLDFVGAGVSVTNSVGKTTVTIPGADTSGLLAKTGLTEWDEQASNPSTPAANKWKAYFKSDGLYIIDDAGTAIGPLDIRNYLAKTGLTEWDEQGSNPSTPAANKWKLFFKSGGLYHIDDAGAVVGPMGVGGMTLLADSTLGSPAANFDLTSIPSTYKHLRLFYALRSDYSNIYDEIRVRLNNDTGNNYDWEFVQLWHSNTINTAEGIASSYVYASSSTGATAPSNSFAMGAIDILNYASASMHKGIQTRGILRFGTSTAYTRLFDGSGYWFATPAAISSIKLYPGLGSNWGANSRVSLFGIS